MKYLLLELKLVLILSLHISSVYFLKVIGSNAKVMESLKFKERCPRPLPSYSHPSAKIKTAFTEVCTKVYLDLWISNLGFIITSSDKNMEL